MYVCIHSHLVAVCPQKSCTYMYVSVKCLMAMLQYNNIEYTLVYNVCS